MEIIKMILIKFILFILFGFIFMDNNYANAHNSNKDIIHKYSPLSEFSSHSIIKPKLQHGRHKRAIKSTLDEEVGLHQEHIILSYHHNDDLVKAELYLNEELIPQGHFLRFQNLTEGRDIIQNFTKTDIDLCHYQGKIIGKEDSSVAVSTCNGGINGVIFDGTTTYYIHSSSDGQIHDDHYLFRDSDLLNTTKCGFHNERTDEAIDRDNLILKNSEFNRILRYKRSNMDIRGPYNANKFSSYVELVLVVDSKVYRSFGENTKKVHNHCKDLANIVNALYVPLNIFVALVGVVIWNEVDEISLSEDGDVTLKNFLLYRKSKLVIDHPNDNAQLLTKEQFNGGVVGKALKGPICTYEYSGGVSNEHSTVVGVVATTVAHEMGHNFGMEHDTSDCKCEDEKCIMSASSTAVVPRHWSSCSKDQLNVAFSRGMNYCLRNKPNKLFDSPKCGNGFVEPGEQCDCGLPQYCQNTCCDPTTCMLYTNASCATGECCDFSTCRPKAAGAQCRSAQGECDLAEFCTGDSEYCPDDVYKRDTIECDNGNAYCYQGMCKSRTAQCKVLWGPSGQSSDYCYEKNVDGSRHGNCGFHRHNNTYIRCNEEDVYCGMLHCKHLNERLEFGMESVAVLSHSFMNHHGNIIPCRTAIVDLGLESTDPGLTPSGAKCGDNKMCVNQKCVEVNAFRHMGRAASCSDDCNGNGICNSKGNCHCFVGWAPPFCNSPGPGGSIDSGPETNPNSRAGFIRFMYIFFLGVVPCVSIFLVLTYFYKNNKSFAGLRKSSNVLKPVIKMSPPRAPPSPPSGGLPTSSPSSTDDMNSALLRSPTDADTSAANNGMFGKFRGFTLRPLPNAAPQVKTNYIEGPKVAFVHPVSKNKASLEEVPTIPNRPAPVTPKTFNEIKQNGTLPHLKTSPKSFADSNFKSIELAPALPPPNPGSHARPIISNPVLEESTCTAKEIPSPLRNAPAIPIRPAPIAPPVPPHADPSKFPATKQNNGTIKRITSFLKKEEQPPHKVRPNIDRERLRTIEISAPIQVDTPTSQKSILNRTQSMRSPSKAAVVDSVTSVHIGKSDLKSSGSMRSANRPKSIIDRPKSPPPRPPAPPVNYKIPINQSKKVADHQYDDCEAIETPSGEIENLPGSADNIYCVIDEIPTSTPPPVPCEPNEANIGLLGEIVNEIEKRNVDSIYSASTLRKKKSIDSAPYENTPVSPGAGEYQKSNTNSTTSSGYLRPSAINNTPVARVAPTRPDYSKTTTTVTPSMNQLSSFSSFKPKENVKTFSSFNQSKNSNTQSPIGQKKPFNRTKTPPSLNNGANSSVRKRSPSPTSSKAVTVNSNLNKSKTSSSPKPHRKLSSGDSKSIGNVLPQKPKPLSVKPTSTISNKTSSNSNVSRQNSSDKSTIGNKLRSTPGTVINRKSSLTNKADEASPSGNKNLNSTERPSVKSSSNVASLQQKFENGASTK